MAGREPKKNNQNMPITLPTSQAKKEIEIQGKRDT